MIISRWVSRSYCEDRISFLENDREDTGIRIHTNWIAIFILTCCGKITAIQERNGKWLYLNRNSLEAWCKRQGVSSIFPVRDRVIQVIQQLENEHQTYIRLQPVIHKIFQTFERLRREISVSYLEPLKQLQQILMTYGQSNNKEVIHHLIEGLPEAEQQLVRKALEKKSSIGRQAALLSLVYERLRNLPCMMGSVAENGGILMNGSHSIFFKCTDRQVYVIDLSKQELLSTSALQATTKICRVFDYYNEKFVAMKMQRDRALTLGDEYQHMCHVIDARTKILQERDRPIAYMHLTKAEATKRGLWDEVMLMPLYPTSLDEWVRDKGKFKGNRHIEVVKQLWTIYEELRGHQLQHLDFKATNVCIDRTNRLVLIDWANHPSVKAGILPTQMTKAFIPQQAYDYLFNSSTPTQIKAQAAAIIDRFAIGVTIYMALTLPSQHPYREFTSEGYPYEGYDGFNEDALREHSYPEEVIAFVRAMCSLEDICDSLYEGRVFEGTFAGHEKSLEDAWRRVQENCPEWV